MYRLLVLTVVLFVGLVVAFGNSPVVGARTASRRVYLPLAIRQVPVANPRVTILAGINSYRATVGAAPLELDDRLNAAAQRQADDMAAHGIFSHVGTDGTQPWDRAGQAGYPWAWVGEDIAGGQRLDEVATAWRNSPPHWEVMRKSDARHAGIALAQRASDGMQLYVFVAGKPR